VIETGEDFSAATKLLETKWIDIAVVSTAGVGVVPILLPAIGRHQPATTADRAEERACEISQVSLLLRHPGARLFEEANQRSSTSRDAKRHQHQHARTVSWKPDVERSILAATDALDGLIIHPAPSYGELQTSGRYFSHPLWPQSEPEIAV
jgi:hypothetical protein